jgi:anti-sigma factor RsiW
MHAYIDGELELPTSLEVERHIAGCPACERERTSLRALRQAFRDASVYYEAPASLERRMRAASRAEHRAVFSNIFVLPRFVWVGAGALDGILAAIVVAAVLSREPPADVSAAREVVDDHLRSLTLNHLTDVLSTNQHTVKPWFDGKLDFTPPVEDLAAEGFPLVGGRLDYLDTRPVAAVVYKRRQHVVNLFVMPAPDVADSVPAVQTQDGYNLVHWTKSGMAYWAVSSLAEAELKEFAQLVRSRVP